MEKLISGDERLKRKCIPFLSFSTVGAFASLEAACSSNVQGYFIKPNHKNEFKTLPDVMISYWSASERPNHGKKSEE